MERAEKTDRASLIYGLAKGLSFRVGNIVPLMHSIDTYKTLEQGTMYITNKKILLAGNSGSKQVQLGKIINVNMYSDCIEIQKQAGKNVYLPVNYENALRIKVIMDTLMEAAC